MRQEGENKRQEAELRFKAEQAQLDRDAEIQVAEIRAAGFTGMKDQNLNQQTDYIDTLEYLDKRRLKERDQQMSETREINKMIENQAQSDLQRQEMQTRENIADKQLQIAMVNKNKYDKKK
jgi:hypothetical protein